MLVGKWLDDRLVRKFVWLRLIDVLEGNAAVHSVIVLGGWFLHTAVAKQWRNRPLCEFAPELRRLLTVVGVCFFVISYHIGIDSELTMVLEVFGTFLCLFLTEALQPRDRVLHALNEALLITECVKRMDGVLEAVSPLLIQLYCVLAARVLFFFPRDLQLARVLKIVDLVEPADHLCLVKILVHAGAPAANVGCFRNEPIHEVLLH